MKLKKISRKTWAETHEDYKIVVGPDSPTGWPEGTKGILEHDAKTGGRCLIPVEIERKLV